MSTILRCISIAICLVTLQCAGIGGKIHLTEEPKIENERLFEAQHSEVWATLLASLDELGYPIEDAEEEAGEIRTEYIQLGEGFLAENELKSVGVKPLCYYCTYIEGRARLHIQVTPGSGFSRVLVNALIEGYNKNVTNRWIRWPSLGKIEARLFGLIQERLGPKPEEILWPSSSSPPN